MMRKHRGLPRCIKRVKKMTGKSSRSVDVRRIALAPGWRISKRGNRYFECRKNRSDRSKKRRY